MWLERLKEMKNSAGMTAKQLSDKTGISEKTIGRIFSGGATMPRFDTLGTIATALGGSLEEIFAESNARVATVDTVDLQGEIDALKAENAMLIAENAVLKEKVNVLTAESEILRLKLDHKEEIIALHNYYNAQKKTEQMS